MHTVKLKINDDIYNHIMFFLKSLDNNKIKILEEKKQKSSIKEMTMKIQNYFQTILQIL